MSTGAAAGAGSGHAASPGVAASAQPKSPPSLTPGPWAEHALCAQADPDAWFPDKGQRALAAIVTRICWHCPVRTQCLDYALSGADTWAGITTGIWGGTTPQERDRLRRQRKAAAA